MPLSLWAWLWLIHKEVCFLISSFTSDHLFLISAMVRFSEPTAFMALVTVFHSADFLLLLIPDDRLPNRTHFLASTPVVRSSISQSVNVLFFACLDILIQTKKWPQGRIYRPSAGVQKVGISLGKKQCALEKWKWNLKVGTFPASFHACSMPHHKYLLPPLCQPR